MAIEDVDVLIVGAGISGIGAACHLRMECPDKRFLIVEGRDRLGGTWDLFRYPGIRSDSDMHTLGFRFKPWTHEKSIADAPAILSYLDETVAEFDLEKDIRYNHRVNAIDWDSETARWTATITRGEGETVTIRCRFLIMGTGYYSYDDPYRPEFPGQADFKGALFHPQFWPEDLDWQGKRIVVIGSGATAVTIVPAMAMNGAAHVTMLQRSPTWFLHRPAKDRLANTLRKLLPDKLAYDITRFKNISMQRYFYNGCVTDPEKWKTKLLGMTAAQLPEGYDVETHFKPRYNPWDQRMCLVPDSDMFQAIKAGQAEVVTDHVKQITESGILLESGRTLDADIIVTATGLKMEIMSGVRMTVDGRAEQIGTHFSYKGCMYSDIPNLASSFGYSNASWTLKADLISEYVCRLLKHMDATGTDIAMPVARDVQEHPDGLMNLSSGYVERAKGRVPLQGDREPWHNYHDYKIDKKLMRHGKLDDGAMTFRKAASTAPVTADEDMLAIAAE